jgi:hypothetical protein
MPPTVITPTPGRIVWYWKDATNGRVQSQPYAAIVTYVHSDHLVDLAIFPAFSDYLTTSATQNVPLWHGEGDKPTFAHCEWMPYQKGQAAKYEELERATKAGGTA